MANDPVVPVLQNNSFVIKEYGTVEKDGKDVRYVDVEITPTRDVNNKPVKRYYGDEIPVSIIAEVEKAEKLKREEFIPNPDFVKTEEVVEEKELEPEDIILNPITGV